MSEYEDYNSFIQQEKCIKQTTSKPTEIDKLKQEIERLQSIIKEVRELVEVYSYNDYYYKCDSRNKFFKSEIINDLKEVLDKENE